MTRRVSIPKNLRDAVLKEYSHQCAICAQKDPQLHHIDEDPSNNVLENLIPLCPNCHLNDIHNPTAKLSVGKLRLFRKYKDPFILKPQFEPIYQRFRFLNEIEKSDFHEPIRECIKEGVAFIKEFEMGDFYSKKIEGLLNRPCIITAPFISPFDEHDEYKQKLERRRQEKIRNEKVVELVECREEVFALLIEMLRYQKWN